MRLLRRYPLRFRYQFSVILIHHRWIIVLKTFVGSVSKAIKARLCSWTLSRGGGWHFSFSCISDHSIDAGLWKVTIMIPGWLLLYRLLLFLLLLDRLFLSLLLLCGFFSFMSFSFTRGKAPILEINKCNFDALYRSSPGNPFFIWSVPINRIIGRNLILIFNYESPFLDHIQRFLALFHEIWGFINSIPIFQAHPVKGIYIWRVYMKPRYNITPTRDHPESAAKWHCVAQ